MRPRRRCGLCLATLALLVLAAAASAFGAPAPTRWCGTDVATTDRPDVSDNAYQVHVVYAYPSDRPSHFADVAPALARDLAAVDTWWQAQDSLGFLGPPQTIRFTVGLGLVDGGGKLVQDTVPPGAVTGLAARKTKAGIVLSWRPVADPGGLRGYQALRNGRLFGRLTAGTALSVPRAKAKGTWGVRAVDRAGSIGETSANVTVS